MAAPGPSKVSRWGHVFSIFHAVSVERESAGDGKCMNNSSEHIVYTE